VTTAPAASETPIWAVGLDPEQLRATEHDGGPLLIIAGAGTGKTRTLVARLACLIDRGVPPDRILLVTFSRRAADEMIRRLAPLVGAERARQIPAGTFHAMAHRLLHRHAASLGLGEGFSVIDQSDALDLMQLIRQEVIAEPASRAPHDRRRRFPRRDTLGSIYSRVVNSQVGLGEVLHRHFPWVEGQETAISSVFSAYTARKRGRRLLDFDDLLLYWRAAAGDAAVGKVLGEAYDHVLVDEYQDTNLLQADIVASLAAGGCTLTVVGDDAEAIYAFRAASGRNMFDFPARYPGTAIVALEHNYRSTQPILDLANFVLAGASEGYAKRLWTETAGGDATGAGHLPGRGGAGGSSGRPHPRSS
jgi:DNA helicase II / ATP-dependent DNA helicase PcrA